MDAAELNMEREDIWATVSILSSRCSARLGVNCHRRCLVRALETMAIHEVT
jgi:hypothetical protein